MTKWRSCSAEHLRGRSPGDTEAAIRTELTAPAARVAAIGKAGENLVRFATISNEGRHAGRGGVGAVMGSKNLKAIALWGDRTTTVADPTGVDRIAEALRERSLSSLTDKYRKIGTVANLAVFDRLGVLPTRNFQQSTFDQATALSGETLTENNFSRRHGCAACTIQCERLFKTLNGEEQRLEYETLFALGPLCGIENPDAVLRAAQLCDHYGMDTISAGGTVAWAMECSERGLLPQTQSFASDKRMICSRSFPRSRNGAAWARCWRKVRGGPPLKSATPANIGRCTSRDWSCPATSRAA